MTQLLPYAPYLVVTLLAFWALMLAFKWREVVPTNDVHIVQSRNDTISFGSGLAAGNVYYAIPSYIPMFGRVVTQLPVNNFSLDLNDYKAYDKDRVPFTLHVTAFFRISDTSLAAQRVQSFPQLQEQLTQVVKGAVRKILASHDIHSIMVSRATFGQAFTAEVEAELTNWGVVPVKNMELMDIKDLEGESKVIANIMAKKSSHIEMESRTEVAANKQKAQTAEIEAARQVELSSIEAKRTTEIAGLEMKQALGERNAEQEKMVGIAKAQQEKEVGLAKAQQAKEVGVASEKASQETKAQAVITKQKEMEIISVQTQRQAEIQKAAALVIAEQEKSVTVTVSQGQLEQSKLQAEGIRQVGVAKGDAEQAMLMAPVNAQTALAKEIGSNENYQNYLVTVRRVEADQAVGIAQAAALQQAEIKVIATTGTAPQGISSVGDVLSARGGQAIGAALEGLRETSEAGAELVHKLTKPKHAPGNGGVA